MIKYLVSIMPFITLGQSFAPEPGAIGTTAMHRDSSSFVGWANNVTVVRGPLNIQNVGLGYASYGIEQDAGGFADANGVVSLGDGGEAIVTFPAPISNGIGPDFAVFENGFIDHYMELAFVEVSSDGVNYFRFEATSEIPTDIQLTNFSTSDCRYVNNLAGKYRAYYGTPFDLEELQGISGLDINGITHVKLIDVVGTIDPVYGSYDSQGTIINDPYPTEFESGGFDLDAIGVIHSLSAGLNNLMDQNFIYPNPCVDKLFVNSNNSIVAITNLTGEIVFNQVAVNAEYIDVSNLIPGIYIVDIEAAGIVRRVKVIKR